MHCFLGCYVSLQRQREICNGAVLMPECKWTDNETPNLPQTWCKWAPNLPTWTLFRFCWCHLHNGRLNSLTVGWYSSETVTSYFFQLLWMFKSFKPDKILTSGEILECPRYGKKLVKEILPPTFFASFCPAASHPLLWRLLQSQFSWIVSSLRNQHSFVQYPVFKNEQTYKADWLQVW